MGGFRYGLEDARNECAPAVGLHHLDLEALDGPEGWQDVHPGRARARSLAVLILVSPLHRVVTPVPP